ncbi:aminotransferase class I/II-fold pyridoxal phosphate-dependent enzyme [Maricaulis sp.]|uniref:trans-sulfuration enzyme family protein n=1 Tax=Maricaulis sp. TaxID=1486257 RepID=UPI001B05C693|nr:aminotransferase class I/II-fold pyridoxal phosphate-dependent enzyme [Maricaulis sp.]MBO6797654.1 PLP-dependent transferase [Maricaulis sp.]
MSGERTRAIRAGLNSDKTWNAVIPPVSLSTAYRREEAGVKPAYDYARTGNPGRDTLAHAISELEGAQGTVVTASGMAAIDLLLHDLPFGARVICSHDAYGGTRRLLDARARGGRLLPVYVDTADLDAVEAALTEQTALVLVETPSNPRLRISDIRAISALARKAGAETAVDNTVLSPILQRPIELGADYSVQSITKIINGHSDMVGGAVSCRSTTRAEQLAWWANCVGVGGGAFDAYLALRGLRTLPVRAREQGKSAARIAQWLQEDSRVARVDYPGLESHPGHALAKTQQSGLGQLISIELVGGDADETVNRLALFSLAQSLGGVESLVNIPAKMTHASMSPEARLEADVPDHLIRLSIGLEDADDLIADLDQALGR